MAKRKKAGRKASEPNPPFKEFAFSLKACSKGPGQLEFDLDLTNPFDCSPEKPSGNKEFLTQHAFEQFRMTIDFIEQLYQFLAIQKANVEKGQPWYDGFQAGMKLPEYRNQVEAIRGILDVLDKSKTGGIGRLKFERHNPSSLAVGFYTALDGNGDYRPPSGDI